MERYEEILKVIGDSELLRPLASDIAFLERQLDELKKLPFIKVHPQYPELQKTTPAAKQYKELLQQYINCIKAVEKSTGMSEEDILESPLRKWVNSRNVNMDG